MSDFPDPGALASRGRRNPEVAERIRAGRTRADTIPLGPDEVDDFPDPEDTPSGEPQVQLLYDGDVVQAKVSHCIEIDGQPSWFSYGVGSHLQPGESESELFDRVELQVNERVLLLAERAEQRIDERARLRASQQRRISARPY